MAHSGRFYPVHFRRDFNLNLMSNNSGFPKGFIFDGTSLTGSIGHYLDLHSVLCPARDEVVLPTPFWQSDATPGGGRTFYIQVTSAIDGISGITTLRGSVFDSVAGEIGRFSGPRKSQVSYGVWGGEWSRTFVPRPDLLAPVGGGTWNVGPMAYSQF